MNLDNSYVELAIERKIAIIIKEILILNEKSFISGSD
jgi:hypothetical protein